MNSFNEQRTLDNESLRRYLAEVTQAEIERFNIAPNELTQELERQRNEILYDMHSQPPKYLLEPDRSMAEALHSNLRNYPPDDQRKVLFKFTWPGFYDKWASLLAQNTKLLTPEDLDDELSYTLIQMLKSVAIVFTTQDKKLTLEKLNRWAGALLVGAKYINTGEYAQLSKEPFMFEPYDLLYNTIVYILKYAEDLNLVWFNNNFVVNIPSRT